MGVINKILCFSLCLFGLTMHCQEIPPIQIYSPQDYAAEDQNWSITQTENSFIYIANNAGLLEYNGASWELYRSPNEDILRSVKSVGDRIYTGGYMDFGYWNKDQYGTLVYTSLTKQNDFVIKEDEEFWGIINLENFVLFQSFERIYIYNTTDKSFEIIDSKTRINKIFEVNGAIYFQKIEEGIFKIENGKDELVVSSPKINNVELVNICQLEKGLLLQTKENGFYLYKNGVITQWQGTTDDILSNYSLYSSVRLKDGKFVLGTISNGILVLSKDGDVLQKIDQNDGLSNNTVLSINEDKNGNIWLGLDNGVNVLNLNSPYRVFKDKQGILGTVYTSEKVKGNLYLGTNQGLFYKKLNSDDGFKLIEGTQGQVWTLDFKNGTLFCGHDQGTFIIENDRATKISNVRGTWIIKSIKNRTDLLLQGNYRGLNVLKRVNGQWRYSNKIEGFDMSSRFMEFSGLNEILVNHEYKGVYKLIIDNEYTKVLDYTKLPINHGVKSSLTKYKASILYCYKDGVFRFNDDSDTFTRDSILSDVFTGDSYLSGKLIYEEEQDRLWGFTKDKIIFVEPGILSNEPEFNMIEISEDMRKIKTGFENILPISDDEYLFGNKEGYITVDINTQRPKSFNIYLNRASYTSLHNEFVPIDYSEPINLENKYNSVQFSYSAPYYNELSLTKYQYKLVGIYNQWSDWSVDSEVQFENLPYGDYELKVRAKAGTVLAANTLSYSFSIDRPWYLKPLAIITYVLLLLLFVFLVQFFNKRYYKRQQLRVIKKKERELELEQLESQRQLMVFKNQNLQLDIDNKNRELGTATMNLVKRNELLNNIKEKLSKSKSLDEVRSVITMINSSLNNTSDWKLFEEAFNNVDKDFMRKVKSLHPSITSNDLRLCAYLRLNLSSKEIAPLLNISHKSVEVKRYRLRKKMGLDHEQSLTNYILEL